MMKKKLHPFYQSIIDSHYKDSTPRTKETAYKFYVTLPKPQLLTKDFIKQRLKDLAPRTRWIYVTFLKPVEKVLNTDLTSQITLTTKFKLFVKKSDLYTKQEILRILEACSNTRDRALFEVLYESAFRAFELVDDGTGSGLNFKNIKIERNLIWLSITGKGSTERTVPIMHSVPSLQRWLDVHPLGEGPVFVSHRRPHRPLNYRGLLDLTYRILKKADVPIRRRPIHLFRHTRLTELTTLGLTEAELCTFAGWKIGSSEAKTYVHMSGRDLRRSFSRIMGIETKDEDTSQIIESITCPRCKTINPPLARFCSHCSLVLDEKTAVLLTPSDKTPLSQKELRELIREVFISEINRLKSKEK